MMSGFFSLQIALRSKLDEIRLKINGDDAEWIETVAITCEAPLDIPDAQDDLKRESELFVSQTHPICLLHLFFQ
jgi:hypothetical protein